MVDAFMKSLLLYRINSDHSVQFECRSELKKISSILSLSLNNLIHDLR